MTTTTTIGAFEIDETPCGYCRKPVRTFWCRDGRGMLSRPSVALVADRVFHSDCWDRLTAPDIAKRLNG